MGESAAAKRIGLILVHGIGKQEQGESLTKFVNAAQQHFDDVVIESVEGDRATLRTTTRVVKVYEAHWAPLLGGEFVADSFREVALFEICWFPTLNRAARVHLPGEYSAGLVRAWTAVLVPLVVLVYLALHGVRVLVQVGAGVVRAFRRGGRRREPDGWRWPAGRLGGHACGSPEKEPRDA